MKQISVLLVGLSGLLGDVVRDTVEQQADMVIVGEISSDRDEIREAVMAGAPDVVVWVGGGRDASHDVLLEWQRPAGKILLLEDRGRRVFLWQSGKRRTAIGELSPHTLAEIIRRVSSEK